MASIPRILMCQPLGCMIQLAPIWKQPPACLGLEDVLVLGQHPGDGFPKGQPKHGSGTINRIGPRNQCSDAAGVLDRNYQKHVAPPCGR